MCTSSLIRRAKQRVEHGYDIPQYPVRQQVEIMISSIMPSVKGTADSVETDFREPVLLAARSLRELPPRRAPESNAPWSLPARGQFPVLSASFSTPSFSEAQTRYRSPEQGGHVVETPRPCRQDPLCPSLCSKDRNVEPRNAFPRSMTDCQAPVLSSLLPDGKGTILW